ncbi:unnamed protein product [Leptosia nina]|uniref:Uncharacterized protein n=1 Tax=Leptosia nina TaxID=320188 RepID=A0AAV1JKI7_9NEOP
MKTVLILSVVAVVVSAEAPLSKSYLPPPPGGRVGYNQAALSGPAFQPGSAPQIIAARNLDIPGVTNGFERSGSHGQTVARFTANQEHGYNPGSPLSRNGLEGTGEPANYNFGYMVNDVIEGTDFGHREERQEEIAQGEYHVVLPDGRKQTVSYKADERGFKPQISYRETEDLSGGYDANANSRSHDNGFSGHDSSFGSHGNGYNGGNGNHGNARNGY